MSPIFRHLILLFPLLSIGCDELLSPPSRRQENPDSPTASSSSESDSADEPSAKSAAAETDAEAAAIIAGKDEEGDQAVDTVEFFSKPEQYVIWKGDREVFKKLFEDIRAAGAPMTHAICSDGIGSGKIAASYIISLPTDPPSRKKVIDLHNAFWTELVEADAADVAPKERESYRKELLDEIQSELASDLGQKYLILSYDP